MGKWYRPRKHETKRQPGEDGLCPAVRKTKYRNRATAQARLNFEKRIMRHEELTHVYKCRACGAWHLTHGRSNKRRIDPYKRVNKGGKVKKKKVERNRWD